MPLTLKIKKNKNQNGIYKRIKLKIIGGKSKREKEGGKPK